jgi:hypothetical protein
MPSTPAIVDARPDEAMPAAPVVRRSDRRGAALAGRSAGAARGRRLGLLAGAAVAAIVAAGCNVPAEQWVPDGNGDGVVDQAEVDAHAHRVQQAAAQLEAHRRAVQAHPFLACVRAHESDRAGGYAAQNPRSSASGAYQFIDSTWRNVSVRAGHPGYARAVHAPWYVQDAVALWLVENGGRSAWAGTGC